MSGHSKWHRIKRKKEATDAKRGQEFTKLASNIQAAARQGNDPDKNPSLREAIDRAKRANMPQDNIDRLLARAADANTRTTTYEAFGPGGSALIIIATTDNTNRTTAELRKLLKDSNSNLATPGSAMWKFKRQSNGHYQTQYPQTLSPDDQTKLNTLIDQLQSHPDVESVYTSQTT